MSWMLAPSRKPWMRSSVQPSLRAMATAISATRPWWPAVYGSQLDGRDERQDGRFHAELQPHVTAAPLGDVEMDAGAAHGAALGVALHPAGRAEPAQPVVRVRPAEFGDETVLSAGRQARLHFRRDRGTAIFVESGEPRRDVGGRCIRSQGVLLAQHRIPNHPERDQVRVPDAGAGGGGRQVKALVGSLQRLARQPVTHVNRVALRGGAASALVRQFAICGSSERG